MRQPYPEILIYIAFAIGIVTIFVRPYLAFLFSAFAISSLNLSAAFFTRTMFGPYLNLVDSLIIVMLGALAVQLLSQRGRKLIFPRPVVLIIICWVIGASLGFWAQGLRYEVAREARWALNLPISILIGTNFVTDIDRARGFTRALFGGALLGALQHLFWVRAADWEEISLYSTTAVMNSIRNIGFLFSPISYFFVAFTYDTSYFNRRRPWIERLIILVGAVLFITSIFLNMTRSHWIAVAAAILGVTMILKGAKRILRLGGLLLVLLILALIIFPVLIPQLDPVDIAVSRYQSIADQAIRYQTTVTRINALSVEGRAWIDGGPIVWLFGNGFGYRWADQWRIPYGATSSEGERVAWGHVGYISYLANLGILGLLVYGFYIPLKSISLGRQVCEEGVSPSTKLLGTIILASGIASPINFFISGSYLQPEMIVPGLLLGAGIGIAKAKKVSQLDHVAETRKWKSRPESAL